MSRTKFLAVQHWRTGLFIKVRVSDNGPLSVFVETEALTELADDGACPYPGKLRYETTRDGYPESIRRLTKYIESLMIRSLGNEDRNTSVKHRFIPNGPAEAPPSIDPEPVAGEDGASVDIGGDGDEPPKRPARRKKPRPEVVEESDAGVEISGAGGDEDVRGPREGDEQSSE